MKPEHCLSSVIERRKTQLPESTSYEFSSPINRYCCFVLSSTSTMSSESKNETTQYPGTSRSLRSTQGLPNTESHTVFSTSVQILFRLYQFVESNIFVSSLFLYRHCIIRSWVSTRKITTGSIFIRAQPAILPDDHIPYPIHRGVYLSLLFSYQKSGGWLWSTSVKQNRRSCSSFSHQLLYYAAFPCVPSTTVEEKHISEWSNHLAPVFVSSFYHSILECQSLTPFWFHQLTGTVRWT